MRMHVVRGEVARALRSLLMPQEALPERRAHHRIPCTGDGDLVIRIWRILPEDVVPKEPKPGAAVPTTPVDISAGGIGLLISADELQRRRLARGVLIGALIERKDARVIFDGEIRCVSQRADGLMRVGISVHLPEMSLERTRSILRLEALVAMIRRIELEQLARFGVGAAKPL